MSELTTMRCRTCGVEYAIPRRMYLNRVDDCKTFYCPNGHPQSYRETDADRLRKEVQREKSRRENLGELYRGRGARITNLERRRAAQQGVATKLRNKLKGGK